MNEESTKNIELFKNFLIQWSDGYKFAAYSYLALKETGNAVPLIVAASIRLLPLLDQSQLRLFTCETASILAGFTVWQLDNPIVELVVQLATGIATPPNGRPIRLNEQGITSQFDPGDSTLEINQPRQATLKFLAAGLNAVLQNSSRIEEINCELRANTIPFDGIGDLLTAIYLDPNQGRQNSEFSVIATSLLAADRSRSVVSKGMAHIECLAAPHLRPEQMRIGIMPFSRLFAERKSVAGDKLSWIVRDDGIAHGSIDVAIGDSQAVQIFVSQNDLLFDRYWIFDPEKHINPSHLRNLQLGRKYLVRESGPGLSV